VPESSESARDVYDVAADWWQRVREGAPEDLIALNQWLEEDDRHRTAFEHVRTSWESLTEFHVAPEILRMRTQYLSRAEKKWRTRSGTSSPTRRGVIAMAAAAVGAAVVVPIVLFFGHRDIRAISTGLGEQRVLVLSDGSRVTMDANSRLDVNFDRELRRLALVKGRVHFDVAKDAARPFRVRALDNTVTAVGTAFTVEVRKQIVSVTLFEGRITVANAKTGEVKDTALFPEVAPGQQIVINEAKPASPQYSQIDEHRALAWRDSQLFFEEEPLSSVADRMNDYSKTRISVIGEANNLRISGMFIAGQTDTFVRAVQRFYPVEVVKTTEGISIQPRT
jgi:transmembrane sensor